MFDTLVTQADLHLMIPEIFVCCAAFALLMVDLFVSDSRRALTHFLALLILVAAAVLTVRELASGQATAFSGFFVRDLMGDVLKLAMYAVTALVFIYDKPYLTDRVLF
jgi:NADH-quinone oxidoreductase subunit N